MRRWPLVSLLDMVDDRFCVIGAGAAGLGAMEVLQRHGIASTASSRAIASAGTGTPTTSRCT